ncbi:hypothetical protein G5S52_23420, partial [Grimontia sp. S25]
LAYYDFSRAKGRWVENVATGAFDALLSEDGLLSPAEALADTDGDGIPDRHELAMCTDSTLADTDGDGLSDGDELGVSGTQAPSNACRADSDGDGIPDGDETQLGSNLTVADTGQDADGDGVSNWSEYMAATQSGDDVLVSGDHTLDVRGLNGYATTGHHASGNAPMTLMYWVNYASVRGAARQGMGSHDGADHRFYLGIDHQNDHSSGIGRTYKETYDSGLSTESWSHLALSYDPSTRKAVVYINGQAVHTYSYITFNEASSRALMLGARNGEQGADSFINGQVDDVQVWSRALSGSEVQGYMLTPPVAGEADLLAYYDFSRAKGRWVENVATGAFDAL